VSTQLNNHLLLLDHLYIACVQVCHFKDKSQPEESKKLIKFVSGLALETIVDVFGVLAAADVKVCEKSFSILYTQILYIHIYAYIQYIHTFLFCNKYLCFYLKVLHAKRCGVVVEEGVRRVQSSHRAALPTGGYTTLAYIHTAHTVHTYIHAHVFFHRFVFYV
jgi:hypothetical protein